MYTSIDVLNVKADYKALKDSIHELCYCMFDVCAILDRLEYFLGHFEDSVLEDDLPIV